MRILFAILLLWSVFVPQAVSALEFCDQGRKACEPHIRDTARYVECIKNYCEAFPPAKKEEVEESKPAITEGLETCDNGLRRCSPLTDIAPAYWLCMEETCNNPKIAEARPVCRTGQDSCRKNLKSYRSCINLVCRNKSDNYHECDEGKRQCKLSLNKYWGCVYAECLGETQSFVERVKEGEKIKNEQAQKQLDKQRGYSVKYIQGKEFRYDLSGKLIAPLLGVPNRLRYPKDGIKPEDYRMTMLPTQRINFLPSLHLECAKPRTRLHCLSEDISSCRCSDGSQPTRKKEKKYVFEQEEIPETFGLPPQYSYPIRSKEQFNELAAPVAKAIGNGLKQLQEKQRIKEDIQERKIKLIKSYTPGRPR